jgi:hypothetical protein
MSIGLSMLRRGGLFLSRRALVLGAIGLVCPRMAAADGEGVPLSLQVELCTKVVKYDKNWKARARDRVRVGILLNEKLAESHHAATTLRREFEDARAIGGLPVVVELIPFVDAAALRSTVEHKRFAIVYLTPGLARDAAAIASALGGADVLSISALPGDVPAGIVLGFDLVSSQPKLWVNLTSAQRQNVAFEPQALKLMKVFR